jgi:hypothetical protein
MDRHAETKRIALRTILCIVAGFSALTMFVPPPERVASPICFAVAIAGLACSCRPVGPP